ncbi:topoisomerase DNA-binding C4 zinc finger domain-containing protein [Desulfosporosinus shakirovi]|uniref:topoisomerase DNA-binding C4 zinc finger domain-containing protein n=1 Tax=Desulfosporosinus shakirovi TaxID=2885154 RepID=UPI00249F6FE1|nr:topoisomerase DNA-binding C4 zinc finger domain-containing protein [Desulfosporosinus sp. SRJS8]MCB8818316.1 topoisomerase DNA-binding C4 zinc finger domain-containing protein [Desulfosporosinus sp. SRJS8]
MVNTWSPQCGFKMILRNGKYGPFYGCTQYPKCRGTRNCKNIQSNNVFEKNP